jgi:hypothetical protein
MGSVSSRHRRNKEPNLDQPEHSYRAWTSCGIEPCTNQLAPVANRIPCTASGRRRATTGRCRRASSPDRNKIGLQTGGTARRTSECPIQRSRGVAWPVWAYWSGFQAFSASHGGHHNPRQDKGARPESRSYGREKDRGASSARSNHRKNITGTLKRARARTAAVGCAPAGSQGPRRVSVVVAPPRLGVSGRPILSLKPKALPAPGPAPPSAPSVQPKKAS